MNKTSILKLTCFIGALAVIFGAFGAHFLKERLTDNSLDAYKTAVLYHFLHTILIIAITRNNAYPKKSIYCFLFGILLFSGSIYFLSTMDVHKLPVSFLGPITPIGGLLLIIGWILLAFEIAKENE